jgi:hypothetical protein
LISGETFGTSGECRHSFGVDNDNISKVVDSAFDDSSWKSGGSAKGSVGLVLWIRCRVPPIEGNLENGAFLKLGRIADTDITYVNGKIVGGTAITSGERTSRWDYFVDRTYYVPSVYLHVGRDNLVVVRAESQSFGVAGLIDGHPKLTTRWYGSTPTAIDILPALFALILTALVATIRFSSEEGWRIKRLLLIVGISTAILQYFNSFHN